MRISDWSSDVCSSDLCRREGQAVRPAFAESASKRRACCYSRKNRPHPSGEPHGFRCRGSILRRSYIRRWRGSAWCVLAKQDFERLLRRRPRRASESCGGRGALIRQTCVRSEVPSRWPADGGRSEEHTSELQSLMRNSYAVFCLIKKNPHILCIYHVL